MPLRPREHPLHPLHRWMQITPSPNPNLAVKSGLEIRLPPSVSPLLHSSQISHPSDDERILVAHNGTQTHFWWQTLPQRVGEHIQAGCRFGHRPTKLHQLDPIRIPNTPTPPTPKTKTPSGQHPIRASPRDLRPNSHRRQNEGGMLHRRQDGHGTRLAGSNRKTPSLYPPRHPHFLPTPIHIRTTTTRRSRCRIKTCSGRGV